jgi:hypothetical protein
MSSLVVLTTITNKNTRGVKPAAALSALDFGFEYKKASFSISPRYHHYSFQFMLILRNQAINLPG